MLRKSLFAERLMGRFRSVSLCGNAVFTLAQPDPLDVEELKKMNVTEFVLNMNPVTGIDAAEKINDIIFFLEFKKGNLAKM